MDKIKCPGCDESMSGFDQLLWHLLLEHPAAMRCEPDDGRSTSRQYHCICGFKAGEVNMIRHLASLDLSVHLSKCVLVTGGFKALHKGGFVNFWPLLIPRTKPLFPLEKSERRRLTEP